jgi:hypothetical protein
MVMDCLDGKMDLHIRVIMREVRNMEKENLSIKMVNYMKVNGKMELDMDKAHLVTKPVNL